MPFAIPIIGEIFAIGRTWLTGKQKVQEAKDTRAAELISQQGTWEQIMAQGSTTSWKDEWILVVFSVPLVMCFVPGLVKYVVQGFSALDTMPEWYMYTLSVIVAASYGVKGVIGAYSRKIV